MDLNYLQKVFVFLLVVMGICACNEDDIVHSGYQTCDVRICGLLSRTPDGSLKAINLNRVTGVSDELNTPENITGCIVNVFSMTDNVTPYVSENIQFVDSGGEDKLILTGINKGYNRFVAETYVDVGVFGGSVSGWSRIFGEISKVGGGDKYSKYNEQIESSYPLFIKFKGECESDIVAGVDNDISFNMEPVNGRMAIIIECFRTVDMVKVYSEEDGYGMPVLELGKNEVGYCLHNSDFSDKTIIRLKIEKYKRKKGRGGGYELINSYYLPEESSLDLLYEPKKYKTQIITVN